ncbi:hypothetical protein SDC9_73852 [bioreactor metagenome]|uniref:Uncharacterized protein n=1 Tax=bioreactor metagenome TaxID=1076179 RepID=A0A644YFF9_9ZZZZ
MKRLLTGCLGLQPLRRRKVHQIGPHDRLRDLVSGHGGHGIAHHAAVPAGGNIGGPRADIRHDQVQKPQLRRDGGVDGGDGLQRQADHLQLRCLHGRVQAVHHLGGQEGSHHIRLQHLAVVAAERGKGIVIQKIARDSVSHQIEPAQPFAALVQGGFSVGHGPRLQLTDQIVADPPDLRQFQLKVAGLRMQRTPCGSDAYPRQLAVQPFLQPGGHLRSNLAHLGDVLNLAVDHGALAVLLLFHGQNVHPLVFRPAHHANDASGTDVQRKDHILSLFSAYFFHGGSPPCACGRAVFSAQCPLSFRIFHPSLPLPLDTFCHGEQTGVVGSSALSYAFNDLE